MPFGDRNFDFGVNMAWLNGATGHDLGENPYFPTWSVAWSEDLVRAYFRDIAAKHFKVVRIWAFEKLEGLQFDTATFDPTQIAIQRGRADQTVILENVDNYEDWNIPEVNGLQPEFLANVTRLMELAAESNLEIYWTILSGGNYFKQPNGHHQWALKKMLEHPKYRNRFIERALLPFLQILQPFRNNVYAIDLINEPEGFFCWNNDFTLGLHDLFNWPQRISYPPRLEEFALDYIRLASNAVKRNFSEFKVSVGFRSRSTIQSNISALNPQLDFFDFHYYDRYSLDPDSFPIFGEKPTIIGELGYMSLTFSFTPDDREQQDAVDGIIGDAIDRNFRGCLVWMYTPHSTSVDRNNLLESNGYNPDGDEAARAAYLDSFNRNPDDHWRPVRQKIINWGEEIERRNSRRP